MDVYIMKPRNETEVLDMLTKQHGNIKYEVNFCCIYLLIFFSTIRVLISQIQCF